jgi:hypothetical protein
MRQLQIAKAAVRNDCGILADSEFRKHHEMAVFAINEKKEDLKS